MRKPSRLPPPPPPPPKSLSQSRTSCNYYSGAESEYSESILSVQSVPHAFNQRSFTSSIESSRYNTAQSESGIDFTTSTSLKSSDCSSRCCIKCYPAAQSTSCQYVVSCVSCSRSRPVQRAAPPVPQERKFRPKISISPVPPIIAEESDRMRLKYRCTSLDYRRHVEQHIERVFRYLKERKERLDEIEADIKAKKLKPKEGNSIKEMLALKETRYLRSLRVPISPRDFEEIKQLGFGAMGKVSLVRKTDNFTGKKNLYAMKKVLKSQVFRDNQMGYIMAERDILAEADNEWIVKLYYSFQDDKRLYFILEYIPGGDLMNILCNVRDVFPEDWARFYISEIALALQYVHSKGYVHRDIKPDNILIDVNGHIKLTDFGLCRGNRWTHDLSYYRDDTFNSGNQQVDQGDQVEHPTITTALTRREIEHSLKKRTLSVVGSTNYTAPEVLRQDKTNEKLCDWWSVGVVLYEMIIGHCPFIDLVMVYKHQKYDPNYDKPDRIRERILNWPKYLTFDIPKRPPISEAAKSLISGWLCEPRDRLCQSGIADIQHHPFFDGIDWQNIRSKQAPYVPTLQDELDTSHFDVSAQAMEDGTICNTAGVFIDFTYRSFWNKPRTD